MTISTCDLSDKYGDKCRFLTPVFRHFSGRKRFHGLIATLRCPEDNTRLKELASTAGCGRVLVVDSGGSLRYALMGDLVGKLALAHGFLRVCFFAIEHSSRIFAPVGVSTEAGHDQRAERSTILPVVVTRTARQPPIPETRARGLPRVETRGVCPYRQYLDCGTYRAWNSKEQSNDAQAFAAIQQRVLYARGKNLQKTLGPFANWRRA